jgi:hypothetical protein
MAMILRAQHGLLTLRCWVELRATAEMNDEAPTTGRRRSPPERVLVSQLYEGNVVLDGRRETPIEKLGIGRDGEPTKIISLRSLAGTEIEKQIHRAAEHSSDGAIWFHIPQDSFELSLLPWENLINQVCPLTVLRIANFLDDPYRPSPTPRVIVCASQPVADGHFPLDEYVIAFLRCLNLAARTASVRPSVYIFTDDRWRSQVRAAVISLGSRRSLECLQSIEVQEYDKSELPEGPDYEDRQTAEWRPKSAWLRWMLDRFKGQAADIVHFICPGFHEDNRGALALSEQPDLKSVTGDFISADGLARFYDRLGCSVMGFSSPDMPHWEWGQRVLTFELSWLRPGPILLYERGAEGYSALARMYAVVLGAGLHPRSHWPFEGTPAQLCCHPRLLEHGSTGSLQLLSEADSDSPASNAERTIAIARARLIPTRELTQAEAVQQRGALSALNFLSSVAQFK